VRGQVHVQPGGDRRPVRHHEDVAVGQVLRRDRFAKKLHALDCARWLWMLPPPAAHRGSPRARAGQRGRGAG
jgi:hypothetical protein